MYMKRYTGTTFVTSQLPGHYRFWYIVSYSLANDSDWFVAGTPLNSVDRLCHLEHTLGGVWTTKLRPPNELELCHHETGNVLVISKR